MNHVLGNSNIHSTVSQILPDTTSNVAKKPGAQPTNLTLSQMGYGQ